MNWLARYTHWLHTQWPAGHVEPLPEIDVDGRTNIPGVYITGDLKGIPLLKFSVDSGTRAARRIAAERAPSTEHRASRPDSVLSAHTSVLDVVIVGAGVSGMAAAREAKDKGLSFQVLEASEAFSTLINFPKQKPIYTYPKEMTPEGDLQVTADIKEALVDELRAQTRDISVTPAFVEKIRRRGDVLEVLLKDKPSLIARRVIIAIGRSGNFRKLNVPGEELDKVYNRLHDPKDFAAKKVLVVGGGDSALETAIALAYAGAEVTLSYRQKDFSRAKPENIEQVKRLAENPMAPVKVENPVSERVSTAVNEFMERKKGSLQLLMGSVVKEIAPTFVILGGSRPRIQTGSLDPPPETAGDDEKVENDVVFTMIGRDAPLNFFRRSGIQIANEWTKRRVAACVSFLLFCYFLYSWKSGGWLSDLFYQRHWFPTNLMPHPNPLPMGEGGPRPGEASLFQIIAVSASSPSFWYTLAYSTIVVIFGTKRMRRRKTPYVKLQTLTLMTFQVVPLFLLPEIILPWMGYHHLLSVKLADALFPIVNYGHGREYWRAYGFILAWPLMIYNVFTHKPLFWWLVISFVQTFVIIPLLIYRWGKGAYCGWICSCGALAETLGDTQRTKMPHGPKWNRLNMAGQVILGIAFLILIVRVTGWIWPGSWPDRFFPTIENTYKWTVDVGLGGIIGVGVYFWLSGRVWCRFFCPLAALMHIYARFSRFRIFAEKKKCISCNVCTSVCHQGIDIMNFANKGLPMNDPQCVRCSACVQMCPTQVLSFGQIK